MQSIGAEYQYIVSVAIGVPPVALAFVFARGERPFMALAGSLQTLLTPAIIFFQDVYWKPQRVFDLAFGIEDFVLNFLLGSMVWFCAVYFLRERYTRNITARKITFRLTFLTAINTPILYLSWIYLKDPMISVIIVQIFVTIEIMVLRPELWKLPLFSAAVYTPFYFVWLWSARQFGVDIDAIWSGPVLWDPRMAGVPIEELFFAATYAACYPLIIGYIADLRARPKAAAPLEYQDDALVDRNPR